MTRLLAGLAPVFAVGCTVATPTAVPVTVATTAATAAAVDRPAPTAPTKPAAPAPLKGVATPPSVAEVAAVIDVRTFPKLPGATREIVSLSPLADVMYEAPGTAAAATDFYVKAFADGGWVEHYSGDARAVIREGGGEYATLWFRKQAHVVTVSLSAEKGEKTVRVSLNNLGSFDARTLPRPAGTTPLGASDTFPNYPIVSFTTGGTVDEATAFARKELAAAGWQAYRADLDGGDAPAGGMLKFRNKAARLAVMVTAVPAQGNTTIVQYMTGVIGVDVPTPPDAADVRLTEGVLHRLRFDTALDAAGVAAFAKNEWAALGWSYRAGASPTSFYFDAPSKDVLAVAVEGRNGKSRVTVVKFTASKEKKDGEKMK